MSYCFGEGCSHPDHKEQELKKVETLITDLKNDSTAAAPTTVSQVTSKDEERQRKWYDSGVSARKQFSSYQGVVSPFYENATADYFFKCGYDNVPFVEAQQVLQTKIKDLLEVAPEVKEVLNELQPQKS